MRSGHECLHFGKLVPVAPFVRGAVGGPKNALCIADSGGVLDFFCLLWLLEKCFLMHLCLSRTPVLFVCRQCPLSLYWLGLLTSPVIAASDLHFLLPIFHPWDKVSLPCFFSFISIPFFCTYSGSSKCLMMSLKCPPFFPSALISD